MISTEQLRQVLQVAEGEDPVGLAYAQGFALSWYGPTCVRLDVVGESAVDDEDERSLEYGSREVTGYDASGTALVLLLTTVTDDETADSVQTYTERVAAWDVDGRNPDDVPVLADFTELPPAYRERFVVDRSDLESGLFYWGPPEQAPHADARALLARIRGL